MRISVRFQSATILSELLRARQLELNFRKLEEKEVVEFAHHGIVGQSLGIATIQLNWKVAIPTAALTAAFGKNSSGN
jgi:hypothetical protein